MRLGTADHQLRIESSGIRESGNSAEAQGMGTGCMVFEWLWCCGVVDSVRVKPLGSEACCDNADNTRKEGLCENEMVLS
jgi:hypothetical protein